MWVLSHFNHCQRSQSNQEQGSLCCSLPCFHVLLCTQYGPLQCFFGKLKEIGVLRPIFLFSCDYILVLCPTLATLAPLFVHTKIENWYLIYLCALQHNLQTTGRETVLAMIKTISSSAAGQWPITLFEKRFLNTCYSLFKVFWFSILALDFVLLDVQTYYETLYNINNSEPEIKCLNSTILKVILNPEVALHKQISTSTITEIVLRI